MEIFVGLYMKPRLSPLFSLKSKVEKAKIRFFSCFKLIFGFFISLFHVKKGVVLEEVEIRFYTSQ